MPEIERSTARYSTMITLPDYARGASAFSHLRDVSAAGISHDSYHAIATFCDYCANRLRRCLLVLVYYGAIDTGQWR